MSHQVIDPMSVADMQAVSSAESAAVAAHRILRVGVVGCGVIGAGLAEACARAGHGRQGSPGHCQVERVALRPDDRPRAGRAAAPVNCGNALIVKQTLHLPKTRAPRPELPAQSLGRDVSLRLGASRSGGW
jgi:hypothetical protein